MVNQIELHPLLDQHVLREYCKKKNIVVTAWSPLCQGDLLADPTIGSLAEKYKKTPAQIILRWDIQIGVVTIPKSVHEERIRDNAKIFDFELSEEDMGVINGMNKNHRIGPDPNVADFK